VPVPKTKKSILKKLKKWKGTNSLILNKPDNKNVSTSLKDNSIKTTADHLSHCANPSHTESIEMSGNDALPDP